MDDLFTRMQANIDKWQRLLDEEQAKAERLAHDMNIDLLLADCAALLRVASVPRSRETQKAGVQKRLLEAIAKSA